jgi:AcrR family transcriptional regulator
MISEKNERPSSRSRARREQAREELRATILAAASELFLEKGYESFSLRQVAERVGYTPTAIYGYFRDKDALLLEAVRSGFEEFDALMRSVALGHNDPLERIEALGRAYIEWGMGHPALYRLMFMQRADFTLLPRLDDDEELLLSPVACGPDDSDVQAAFDGALEDGQVRSAARLMLVRAVCEASSAGLLRPGPPLVVADILWSGAHGLVSLALSPLLSSEHAQTVVDPLLRALIEGVRAEKAPASASPSASPTPPASPPVKSARKSRPAAGKSSAASAKES